MQLYSRALNSRKIWIETAQSSDFFLDQVGSIILAYKEDEYQVMKEYCDLSKFKNSSAELLSIKQIFNLSPYVLSKGLIGGLWSPTEMIVDPREAIKKITILLKNKYGVEFNFGTTVSSVEPNLVVTSDGNKINTKKSIICSGADFESLFPQEYKKFHTTKSKLQMLRTISQPKNFKLGPALCSGFTLTHYDSFAECSSINSLKDRYKKEFPFAIENGIHIMISQNGLGEIILGDSHEYGLTFDPFNNEEINKFIVDQVKSFISLPSIEIASRWNGIYPKLIGGTELIKEVDDSILIVNCLGGAGMTQSFGLAEEIAEEYLNF